MVNTILPNGQSLLSFLLRSLGVFLWVFFLLWFCHFFFIYHVSFSVLVNPSHYYHKEFKATILHWVTQYEEIHITSYCLSPAITSISMFCYNAGSRKMSASSLNIQSNESVALLIFHFTLFSLFST